MMMTVSEHWQALAAPCKTEPRVAYAYTGHEALCAGLQGLLTAHSPRPR
jgi:hypothetical protein